MTSRYETVFNTTSDFFGILEPDGTLIEANAAALDFAGISGGEVIGKKLWKTKWIEPLDQSSRQLRAAIKRARDGEEVSGTMAVQGEERVAVFDYSIYPLFDEHGNVTRLLSEGHEYDRKVPLERGAPHTHREPVQANLLVSYKRDTDESITMAVLCAFYACNIDVFDQDSTLEDWISTDALEGFAWNSDCPHVITTRLWGYPVVISTNEVRIFNNHGVV